MAHSVSEVNARASFEALVHRVLDVREADRPALIGELQLPNGRIAPVAQAFRDACPDLFFSLLPEIGYVLPSKAVQDLNEVLSKVSGLPNFDEIRKRLEPISGGPAFKSRDSALYEIDRVYKELPALIGDAWHDSDLRKVLGKILSDLTMVDEEQEPVQAPQATPSAAVLPQRKDVKAADSPQPATNQRRTIQAPVFRVVPPAQNRPLVPPRATPPHPPVRFRQRARRPHLIDDDFAKLVRKANKTLVAAFSTHNRV
jgi:hypothetical protein